MKVAKFNVHNKDKSNAYAVVRLPKKHFEVIREFLHQDGDIIKFPKGVTMVHQGSGYYKIWGADWNEDPTASIILAIRISSKALFTFFDYEYKRTHVKHQSYVNGEFQGQVRRNSSPYQRRHNREYSLESRARFKMSNAQQA